MELKEGMYTYQQFTQHMWHRVEDGAKGIIEKVAWNGYLELIEAGYPEPFDPQKAMIEVIHVDKGYEYPQQVYSGYIWLMETNTSIPFTPFHLEGAREGEFIVIPLVDINRTIVSFYEIT